MDNLVNFGERLDSLLFDNKIKPETLAKNLNVAVSTVYYWKNGEKEISLSHLIAMSNYFGCTIEYLVGREQNEGTPCKVYCTNFGKRVRQVMKERGSSTYKLRKLGIGSRHFQNWDNGADPMLSTLILLAEAFDVTLDNLVGRE